MPVVWGGRLVRPLALPSAAIRPPSALGGELATLGCLCSPAFVLSTLPPQREKEEDRFGDTAVEFFFGP